MKFIIDTNVLLSYPKILEEEKRLVITRRCLKEIDGLKKSDNSELAFQSRRASSMISEQKMGIEFIMKRKIRLSVDDEILYFAKKYHHGIVTNDVNVQIAAYYMGIECQGYSNLGAYYAGIQTLRYHFDSLLSNPEVDKILTTLQPPVKLNENEFLIIENEDTNETHCILRYHNGQLEIIDKTRPIQNKWTHKILPRNSAQECLFNLLFDKEVKIILAQGKFGSGKTMCLANYALQELEKGRIDKLVWVPNNSFNQDSREIAALPGNLYEKELPFLGSLVDIMGESEVERLLGEGLLEIVPVSIMRGRNIRNSIILVNEAQNLTEEHIKLLVGRCADHTRIFFDGDIKQVDSYVFKNKNGLRLLLNLANSPIFSKIFGVSTLNTIERSLTAQASDYLDSIA